MKFRLPEAPRAAFLTVEHLASADNEGKCVSPVSIIINGKPLVEEWNVGQGKRCETAGRWATGSRRATTRLSGGQGNCGPIIGCIRPKWRSHSAVQSRFGSQPPRRSTPCSGRGG